MTPSSSFVDNNYISFIDVVCDRAQKHPDKKVFTFLPDGEEEGPSFTNQELDQKARAIAGTLQGFNLKGERALLWFNPGLDFISAFIGCLYAGIVAVPVYPPRKNKGFIKLDGILNDSAAKLILTSSGLQEHVLEFLKGKYDRDVKVIACDAIEDRCADDWVRPDISGTHLTFLQYTSGSTGNPKGVMISHSNLLHNCEMIRRSFATREGIVLVSWLPLYHDMGLIGSMLENIYCGSHCIMMPPVSFLQKPFRWLRAISHYGAEISGGPNFAYDLCCEKITPEQLASLDLKKWKLAFNGAEPVRAETLDRFSAMFAAAGFRKNSFLPCYGMAEGTLLISGKKKKSAPSFIKVLLKSLSDNKIQPAKKKEKETTTLVSCGLPIEDQQLLCVNPDTKNVCSEGEIGEIWVSSPSVGQGYWNQPELTNEFFKAQLAGDTKVSFLRTGDMGSVQDGEVYITGRLKDLVIIRGRNFYPPDLEQTIAESSNHLGRNAGAAFSVEVEGQERLVIVQEVTRSAVRNADMKILVNDIRLAIAEKYELQCHTIILLKPGSILKTSSGKIQRRACKKTFLEGGFEVLFQWSQANSYVQQAVDPVTAGEEMSGYSPDTDPAAVRQWLIAKVSEHLKVDAASVNVKESLEAYGLDSLAAVQIAEELGTWLNRELPPTLIYDYPSIHALTEFISGEASDAPVIQNNSGKDDRRNEPIAVIGMGCRFPGAPDISSFWELLSQGKDAVKPLPAARTMDVKITQAVEGGFLDKIDGFDPHFFGISPREANGMDPQQRLLLEVSWEALENAGIDATDLSGEEAGVFIGISSNDYLRLSSEVSVHSGTNNAFSIAANRLSYFLDLKGPSVAIDTACSSSLVAVHQACQSLRQGECTIALAGGVNVILGDELNNVFSQAGMLAANSRCKTFDAAADGYVRGEGCGVIVLKPLSQALKDNDPVLAVIRGSAVNQDGKSNGLTAPNGPSQERVILKAILNAGITPSQISYVETHGSGTSLGDPIEVNALKKVLLSDRHPEEPCWIGTVKTNIGHLEAAAGIAGMIKTILSLQHKTIPAHLHFQKLNPLIAIENTSIKIPEEKQVWNARSKKRLAGVSSFGFGGTNAHIVLEESPDLGLTKKADHLPMYILPLSAKTEQALLELALSHEKFLRSETANALENICFTSSTGRTHFDHRMAIAAATREELQQVLENFRAEINSGNIFRGEVKLNESPRIAFLFTGQGSQYTGMGKMLYDTCQKFRDIVDHCDSLLKPYLGKSLTELMFSDKGESLIHQTAYTQPALFVLEYALARLWMSWGIQPDFLLGHSVGEYTAACIAGVFSLEDGLMLIASRARLMQEMPSGGAMASVFAHEEKVASVLGLYREEVAVAAVNGPEHIAISGNEKFIDEILSILKKQGVSSRKLEVSHAFHSPLMKPAAENFRAIAEKIEYAPPTIKIISNVTGKIAGEELCSPEYWVQHLLSPVLFKQGMKTLEDLKVDCYIEAGPQPTLLALGKSCTQTNDHTVWLPSLRPKQNDVKQMYGSFMQLYVRGARVDWKGFYSNAARRKVILPTYPFQRQRCWVETTKPTTDHNMHLESGPQHPLLGHKLKSLAGSPDRHAWEIVAGEKNLAYLRDHLAWGTPVMPHTVYVGMALAAAEEALGKNDYMLANLQLHGALFIPENEPKKIQILLEVKDDGSSFRVFSSADIPVPDWVLYASAVIYPGKDKTSQSQNEPPHKKVNAI